MGRLKPAIIDGECREVSTTTPISSLFPKGETKSTLIVTDTKGKMEIVSPDEAEKRTVGELVSIDRTYTTVQEGDSKIVETYFIKEEPYLRQYLAGFESNNGKTTSFRLQSRYENGQPLPIAYLEIENLILPDRFGNNDTENIVIPLPNYPLTSPWGFFIYKNSINKEAIINALKGHVYGQIYGSPHGFEKLEACADWVCLHYENKGWNYNFSNPNKGDCLYKYLMAIWLFLQ